MTWPWNCPLSLFCPKGYQYFRTPKYLFYRCACSCRWVLHSSQLLMELSELIQIRRVESKHIPPHTLHSAEEVLVTGLGPGVT